MAEDDNTPPKKVKFHSLPATEGLIFDIVKYLLEGNGASSSREIVEYISFGLGKSRRHTAPEIVGVLRNRRYRSFLLDLHILILTVEVVLFGKGR